MEGFPKNRTFTVHEGGRGEARLHSERPNLPPERKPRTPECEGECLRAEQHIQFLQGIARQSDPGAHDRHEAAETVRRRLNETNEYDDEPARAVREVQKHLGVGAEEGEGS